VSENVAPASAAVTTAHATVEMIPGDLIKTGEESREPLASRERVADFPDRRHLAHKRKGAVILHFAGAFEEGGKGDVRHRAADADAFDAGVPIAARPSMSGRQIPSPD
jgi:hypothetical protein